METKHYFAYNKHILGSAMIKMLIIAFTGFQLSCSINSDFDPKTIDLTEHWDTIRPIANPDKGWYHHLLDNGIGKYLIQDEEEFLSFPGMDHLYLRLCWAYLEPEEGKFDWSYIDNIVEKYVPLGYQVSFRISCKETGPAPTSVPYEVDGIRYATPYWVVEAGAKGVDQPEYGPESWCPIWNDPVYLEKLNNFHRAFAQKYDGQPWVRYVDVGSIGEWGEGHTWRSTRIPVTLEEIKTHINLHLKHYKNTQLIVTDDFLYNIKDEAVLSELLAYTIENEISFRDDSPLVAGYFESSLDTWTVRSPEFFEAAYKYMPTVFELQHYGTVKKDGNWIGQNGEETIPKYGVSGAQIFRESMKLIRPTYIGYHGYHSEWLNDNPELTIELLNKCGYWYFPGILDVQSFKKNTLSFSIEWLNKGVAPAYSSYQLKGKLLPRDSTQENISFEIGESGNLNWFPDQPFKQDYEMKLLSKPVGNYKLAIQLYDSISGKPVDIGLSESLKSDDFFIVQNLKF